MLLQKLFTSTDFMPHGHCFLWEPSILWLHVASDFIIFASYFSIPLALVCYVSKRRDLSFNWVVYLFATFIFACGTTHLMSIYTIWFPAYGISGLVKLITALVSLTTAIVLWPLIPKALKMPSREDIEKEVLERRKAQEELERAYASLEQKVADRTEEVEEGKLRYLNLLSIITSVIWNTDDKGNFVEPQISWTTYTSQSWDQQLGRGWLNAFHPSHISHIANSWDQSVAAHRAFQETGMIWNEKLGQYRQCEMKALPFKSKRKNTMEWIGALTDVHDTFLSQEQFKQLFEASPSGLVLVDSEGIISLANRQALKLFGYKLEELVGQKIEMLIPDRYKLHHPSQRDTYFAHPSARAMGSGRDLFGKNKDGSEFPVEVGLSTVKTTEGVWAIAAILDISERTAAEKRRRSLADELSRSNKELERFAYVASHDLKAPLRAIDNLAKWIAEDSGPQLSEQAREDLELMQGRVKRMESLLDGLLEYSRVDRIKSPVESLNVKQIISDTLDLLALPENYKITVVGPDISILSPRPPFQLVLRNLISNSMKHNDKENGEVNISLIEAENLIEITVSDNGPGIPHEFQEKVFEMFQTLKPRDEVEGTGIGLAIVKKTVLYHKGTITLKNNPKEGCSFTFTWPKEIVD